MRAQRENWKDHYYVMQPVQNGTEGLNIDPSTVVLDVTGLPDSESVQEVARLCEPDLPCRLHNLDGLIFVRHMSTSFWAFRMDMFNQWGGRYLGIPNISSAQNWDDGPQANDE